MMKLFVIVAVGGTLIGCAAPALVIYDASKTEARAHTARIMAKLRPELNAQASGGCVYDNMTGGEILAMGTSDVSGISQKHLDTVQTVLARPKTQACLANAPLAAA